MRLYLWILSRILPSYEADSPVSAYASVDASSDSASERVEVEQAHSLKEAFRPVIGLLRGMGSVFTFFHDVVAYSFNH